MSAHEVGSDVSVKKEIDDDEWEIGFNALQAFKDEYGHCDVPIDAVTVNGFKIGRWAETQRCELGPLREEYEKGLKK
jgi:hypothetical protein